MRRIFFMLVVVVLFSVIVEAPHNPYGMMHDSITNTYMKGNYVYSYDKGSGLYTTQDTGTGVFRALNPNTGQVVAYSDNQPVQMYGSGGTGAPVLIDQYGSQYSEFLPYGYGSDPVAAQAPVAVPGIAPAPAPAPAAQPSETECVGDCANVPLPGADSGYSGYSGSQGTAQGTTGSAGSQGTIGGTTQEKPKPSGVAPIGGNVPQGGTQPAGAGTSGAQPQTQYSYVVTAEGGYTDSTGKTWPTGSVLTFDQKVSGLTEITPEQKKFTDKYAGKYTYSGGSFTSTSTKTEEGTIEDYRTTTTVTINADGSKTVDQQYSVCGQGLLASCEETGWVPQNERRQTVTTTTDTTTTSKGKKVTYQNSQTTTQYDSEGKKTGTTTTTNQYYERTGTTGPSTVTVKDDKGNIIYTIDKDGESKYADESKLTKEQEANIDRANVNFVNAGGAGFGDACALLGTARCAGRFLRAFNEYSGLRQYSSIGLDDYDAQVRARKAEIQQEFCIAMGITQCLASKICEQRHELEAGNVVGGRGPGGQYVTSASLNAERTPPIEIEGMTRQQLVDLFGNATVIAGRLVNLTDPAFKPETLGRLKLRLYHVQYSVTNNLEEDALTYNLAFIRVPDQANSSYGKAAVEAKWFPGPKYPTLAKGDTAGDHIYKFSATEYSDICLTFNPGLPSGSPSGGFAGGDIDTANRLCVPFSESTTATEGAAPPGAAAPPAEAPTGQTPGGQV